VKHRGMSVRILIGCLVLLVMGSLTSAQDKSVPTASVVKSSGFLTAFQVVEFRRYTIREGERERFAEYFESYFPEAFQQLGAIAVGQFLSRTTWMLLPNMQRQRLPAIGPRARVRLAFW
jgi:hypothetical protein